MTSSPGGSGLGATPASSPAASDTMDGARLIPPAEPEDAEEPEAPAAAALDPQEREQRLKSREAVAIPHDHAAEMSPYLTLAGEFRVHYAGFFDPGFGMGEQGRGARGVLEVRCHEAPFALEHGQCVGRLVYERMSSQPERLYGTGISSNYQGQGLKLAKQFIE